MSDENQLCDLLALTTYSGVKQERSTHLCALHHLDGSAGEGVVDGNEVTSEPVKCDDVIGVDESSN